MAFGTSIYQRKINKRNHIIDLFRKHGPLSKAMTRKLSGYSMDTVISIFNTLSREKMIIPVDAKQKSKGRKAEFYSLNNEHGVYLGITFNQTGIYSAIVSFSSTVLDRFETLFPAGIQKKDFTSTFRKHCQTALERIPGGIKTLCAVGCSVPGDIDIGTGILHSYIFIPFLRDVNFTSLIRRILPKVPIVINHNIHDMMAFLIKNMNDLTRFRRILFVSARSGVASGLIQEGRIITCRGEMGHVRVSDEPVQCDCGRSGCLDCYFSSRGFLELIPEPVRKNAEMSDKSLPGGNPRIDKLLALYQKGNRPIKDELDTRLDYFTKALLDTVNITVPDCIVLTGEMFKIYGNPVEAIVQSVKRHFSNTGFVNHFNNARLLYRELGTEIASIGSCFEMIDKDWSYIQEGSGV